MENILDNIERSLKVQKKMTYLEFMALCGKYAICTGLALEDAGIVGLLKEKQYNKVEEYLKNNF